MSKVSLPKGYRGIISQSHNSPLSLRIYIIKIYLYLVYYTCTYNRSELNSKSFQTPVQPWVLSHSIVGWLYKVKAYYKMILNLISGNLVSWTRSLWLLLPSMQQQQVFTVMFNTHFLVHPQQQTVSCRASLSRVKIHYGRMNTRGSRLNGMVYQLTRICTKMPQLTPECLRQQNHASQTGEGQLQCY